MERSVPSRITVAFGVERIRSRSSRHLALASIAALTTMFISTGRPVSAASISRPSTTRATETANRTRLTGTKVACQMIAAYDRPARAGTVLPWPALYRRAASVSLNPWVDPGSLRPTAAIEAIASRPLPSSLLVTRSSRCPTRPGCRDGLRPPHPLSGRARRGAPTGRAVPL